jgi:hypothetical protein
MKRDPSLALLSRDHHQALFVAQRLRRARADTAGEALEGLRDYWDRHGRSHFRAEEEILFPAYAAYADPYAPMIAKLLCDHVAIRHQAQALFADTAPDLAALHELGRLLTEHVRSEERELFPLIEATLPPRELAALGSALEQATAAC